jgi:hypothetical protein
MWPIYRAFIRYEMRLVGYFSLLVPTYPGELFGDLVLPVPVPVPGGDPSGQYLGAGAGAGAGASRPAPQRPWMLVLSRGAKRFLLVTIVLGVAASSTKSPQPRRAPSA